MNLPFYNPGYLPPIALPPYSYTPPFVAPMPTITTDPTLTPTPQQAASMPTGYEEGPFCFGLDKLICAKLPETLHIGPSQGSMMSHVVQGTDLPVWRFCYALTNTLCATLVLVLLLSLVGIGVYGLLS